MTTIAGRSLVRMNSSLSRLQPFSSVGRPIIGTSEVNNCFSRRRLLLRTTTASPLSGVVGRPAPAMAGPPIAHHRQQQQRTYHHHSQIQNYYDPHNKKSPLRLPQPIVPSSLPNNPNQQTRRLAIRPKKKNMGKNKRKKAVDPNAPLLNEHLVAELFKNNKNPDSATADTYEVRLVVDQGFQKEKNADADDDDDDDSSDSDDEDDAPPSVPTTQVTTLASAIAIAHSLSLDLMEVTLTVSPPVIKAVDFESFMYHQKKKDKAAESKKKKDGGGAISDRPLKEFKFRAGIADHDLERKTNNMLGYLNRGHAIRVTLTARMKSLKADEDAIATTFERVKELVGDRAVEARGMKANERKSFGSLLLHPNKGSK